MHVKRYRYVYIDKIDFTRENIVVLYNWVEIEYPENIMHMPNECKMLKMQKTVIYNQKHAKNKNAKMIK